MLLDEVNELIDESVVLLATLAFLAPSLTSALLPNSKPGPVCSGGSGRNARCKARHLGDLGCSFPRPGILPKHGKGCYQSCKHCPEAGVSKTHSTPAVRVYITALADEMPIPPDPWY